MILYILYLNFSILQYLIILYGNNKIPFIILNNLYKIKKFKYFFSYRI